MKLRYIAGNSDFSRDVCVDVSSPLSGLKVHFVITFYLARNKILKQTTQQGD